MEGIATLDLSKMQATDTLVVSYIGYRSQKIFFSKEQKMRSLKIKLKPAHSTLKQVVVTSEKPIKAKKIIKKAIKNTAKNYSNKNVILNSFYRETTKENDRYIQLNEGFTKIHYTSYPKKKLDAKIWKDWYYDETYAFDTETNLKFSPLLKDFNTKADKQSIIASRHSENWSQFGMTSTWIGDPLLLLALDKIKYQYDFLFPWILRKYRFKNESQEFVNGELCYVISFLPKSKKKRFKLDQARKNKSAIYIGRIYIAKESFAVVKFQYKLAVERDFGFFERSMPLDYQVEVNYKKQQDLWFIHNIKLLKTKKVSTTKIGKSVLHTTQKELQVLDLETENVVNIPDSIVFKSTRYSSLRSYRKNYNPSYWNTHELPHDLKLSTSIINDLEKEKPLEEQFDYFINKSKKDLPQPKLSKRYFAFNYHDTSYVDSLHWVTSPEHEQEFRIHLANENKYAKNQLLEDEIYQRKLFDQLNQFYPETEDNPQIRIGTYFIAEDSLDSDILYYQKDSIEKIKVFDISAFKESHKNIFIYDFVTNKSKNLILVQYSKVGNYSDFAVVLPFGKNEIMDSISNVYSIGWFSDSTYLYAKTNKIGRAATLMYRSVFDKNESLIYTEIDPTFDIEILTEKDKHFCTIQSKTENEIYSIIPKEDSVALYLIKKRKDEVMNTIKTADGFYILVQDENKGSYIEYATFDHPDSWLTLIDATKNNHIDDFTLVKNKIIALVYENSIPKVKYFFKEEKKWMNLEFDLGIGRYYLRNIKNNANKLAFSFSSPAHPYAAYQYDFETQKLIESPKRRMPKEQYFENTIVERIWAKSEDGTNIPITLVKNRDARSKQQGLILNVYGAYGANTTPSFEAQDAILLLEGYTLAYAHVRGESIMGTNWYKMGREMNKKNSIMDYIACAEHLINKKYTTANFLVGYGNSAGGLIVAQAANKKPELFNTLLLDHAYLDVINTMMNDTLPLTIDEYKELGNPQKKEVFANIIDYSPYQNIKTQHYPNMLFTAGYQDFRTPVWQIAKYVSKLREYNLANTEIILLTDMNSGHIGSTSDKGWIKLFAQSNSFLHLNLKK